MEREILQPVIIEMLRSMETVLKEYNIDFYLVGAIARDVHLSREKNYEIKRHTNDVDIAIMLADEEQFYVIKDALLATGDFTEHDNEAIKLFYKQAVEIDLLPFGDIENEEREIHIHKPKLFVMDVPGFMELLLHTNEVSLGDVNLNVCPLEGLIILKLLANDDRPDRTKDITDIEQIIETYFYLNSEDIWTDHNDIVQLYGANSKAYLSLVSARIIGERMRTILEGSDELKNRIRKILSMRASELWQAMYDGMQE